MMKNRNVDDAITYANRMNCASKDVGRSIVGEATSERLTNRKAVSRTDKFTKPTGGCIKCAKCTHVRTSSFCGNTKLTNKQLYNEKGYCSEFVPKCGAKMEGEQE
jgi:hypothetical protein